MSSANQPATDPSLATSYDSTFGAFFKEGQLNSNLWGGSVTLNGPPLQQQQQQPPPPHRHLAQLLPAPAVDTTTVPSGTYSTTGDIRRATLFNKYAAGIGIGPSSDRSSSSASISNGNSSYASNNSNVRINHNLSGNYSNSNGQYSGALIAVPPTARRQASSSSGGPRLPVAMPPASIAPAPTVPVAAAVSSGVIVDDASASPGLKSVRVYSFPVSLLDQIEDLATPLDLTPIPHADLVNFSPQGSHNQPADKRGRPPAAAYRDHNNGFSHTGGGASGGKGRKAGFEQRCAMCHRGTMADGVIIPVQNKQVCTECDTSVWRSQSTSVYFKWCKGCKRFHNILMFREKLQLLRESGKKQLTKLPSKCDPCRQRGRLGYRSKKEGGVEEGPKKRGPKGPKSVTDARKLALLGVTHLTDAAAAAVAAEAASFSTMGASPPVASLGTSSGNSNNNNCRGNSISNRQTMPGMSAHEEHVYPSLALNSTSTRVSTSASASPPLQPPPPPALFYGSSLGRSFRDSSHHLDQEDSHRLNNFLESFGSINGFSSNSNKRARTPPSLPEPQSPPRGVLRLLDDHIPLHAPAAVPRITYERLSSNMTRPAPALLRAPAVNLAPTEDSTPSDGLKSLVPLPVASEQTGPLMHL